MGGFETAIALLQPCIAANAYSSTEELITAYELLANVYIAINDEDNARQAITGLLEVAPDYEPDPTQSRRDFLLLVDEIRPQLMPLPTPEITSVATDDLANTITWTFENAPSIASFALFKGTSTDTISLLTTLPVASLSLIEQADGTIQASYVDTELTYSTTYSYAIEALDENNNAGTRSSIERVTTPDQPAQVDEPIASNEPSQTTGGRKKVSPWIFVGGGAVAGGLAILLSGGDGGGGNTVEPPPPGDSSLPTPPPLP